MAGLSRRVSGGAAAVAAVGLLAAAPAILPGSAWAEEPPAAHAAAPAEAAVIEPEAAALLRRMSDLLAGSQQFSFKAATNREFIGTEGQIIHFFSTATALVHRPDRLRYDLKGEFITADITYDGKTLTFYHPDQATYTQVPLPAPLNAMLDAAAAKLHLDIPLADFLDADPYATFTANASGVVVGKAMIGDAECLHLSFFQPGRGWELWIETGKQALPRRFVLTDMTSPTQPRFVAELSDWNLSATATDSGFTFTPPPGAKPVAFQLPPAGGGADDQAAPATKP